MLLDEEIAEERSVAHLDIEVRAPGGWVKVTHICRTVPMPTWILKTALLKLECAGKHLVVTPSGDVVPVDALEPGQLIHTEFGVDVVVSVEPTGLTVELYDLRVDSSDHIYYTGGIASHNSTGLGATELFKCNLIPNHKSIT